VEILTSKKQQPQPEWIEYVTTARAKARLRVYFKREEKNLIADGQKKVEQALLDLQKKNDNETLLKVMKYFDFTNRNAFYLQVGLGKIKLDDLGQTVFKPKSVFTKYLRIPFVTPSGKTAPEQPEVVRRGSTAKRPSFSARKMPA